MTALFVDTYLYYMSIFNQAMDLSSNPAMDQMGEIAYFGSTPIKVIADPVSKFDRRIVGGRAEDNDTTIFIKRDDFIENNISKGSKLSMTQNGETIRMRVGRVDDDGTDLITLNCGGLLTATVPL